MKFLLLLVVLGVAVWVIGVRRRGSSAPPPSPRHPAGDGPHEAMLACARCGLHLPQTEVLIDAAGRAYCSEAHRAAGPA